MWSIHTVEYYSVVKRNEVLIHATTWMTHKDIKLSERNQKTTYCYFIDMKQANKSIETKSTLGAARC